MPPREVALDASAGRTADWRGPPAALARRAFRDGRTRTVAFAYLFAVYAYIQVVGYRQTYPTLSSRIAFAHSFANSAGLRLFYGEPRDLLTVGGYSAWRVGGTLAIAAAAFGLLAAVRASRTEEETGRTELVLAGVVGRRTVFWSGIAGVAAAIGVLWVAEFAGFVVGGLSVGGSAYLALATVSVVPPCVAVGAVVSQLAPTRRMALELGGAIVGLLFLLRVVADTSSSVGWLRWATPLGWAEELRPFTGERPIVLLLPVVVTTLGLAAAAQISTHRDIGTGLLHERDRAHARLGLLSSPTAHALRSERSTLIAWVSTVAVFAFVLGVVSQSVSSAGISQSLRREIARLGSGSIATPTGYIAFVFLVVVVVLSLFTCAQVGAARHAEADGQLETLLAQPLGRTRWLCGRLLLAMCAVTVIAIVCGLVTWIGTASVSVQICLPRLLEAGVNCLPAALLFLGVAALAYAAAPRAGVGIAYGLVTVTFLWQLVSSLLSAPRWLVDLTPFAHVGLVPSAPAQVGSAAIMIAIGGLFALVALTVFRHRDLTAI